MSHLMTLTRRFEKEIEKLALPKMEEQKIKERLMDIIEYVFFFRQYIERREIQNVIEELDLGKRNVDDYDKLVEAKK